MSNGGIRRRLEDLERRPPRPQEGPSGGRRRMVGFLSRVARARQSGTMTEELRAETEDAREAIRGRLDRGEGYR